MRGAALLLGVVALAGCVGARPVVDSSRGGTEEGSRLSPAGELGRRIFFDPGFSASGKMSCGSCHSPDCAYGPPNGLAVQLGGPELKTPGLRAVPSLRYTLARTPRWSHPRPVSVAEQAIEKDNGPAGGFGWDGRFDSLHEQAGFPLTAASEMASNERALLARLREPQYAATMRKAFGDGVLDDAAKATAAMRMALERFELEDTTFHPYTSRYDAYLEDRGTLTAQELRGLALFNDTSRGNCGSCHLAAKGADGSHPLLTDYQFEAIGVPRNREIAANRDARFFDLGLCGPLRTDAAVGNQTYCGMFKTPTLRNVAGRRAFFHNGRFHSLKETLAFYVERDTDPAKWYGRHAGLAYDDLPVKLRGNVDRTNLPFASAQPVWNEREMEDVLAFLRTLNDADVKVVQ